MAGTAEPAIADSYFTMVKWSLNVVLLANKQQPIEMALLITDLARFYCLV